MKPPTGRLAADPIEVHNLQLIGLHPTLAGKRTLRIIGKPIYSTARL
jgi:hypothetical protein